MSGKIIREGIEEHRCPLPQARDYEVDEKVAGFINVTVHHHPGTVWQCDCGKTWLLYIQGSWRELALLERLSKKWFG